MRIRSKRNLGLHWRDLYRRVSLIDTRVMLDSITECPSLPRAPEAPVVIVNLIRWRARTNRAMLSPDVGRLACRRGRGNESRRMKRPKPSREAVCRCSGPRFPSDRSQSLSRTLPIDDVSAELCVGQRRLVARCSTRPIAESLTGAARGMKKPAWGGNAGQCAKSHPSLKWITGAMVGEPTGAVKLGYGRAAAPDKQNTARGGCARPVR
jgi:hypothetical protein